jgi:Tfp pilus assembly protein PilO
MPWKRGFRVHDMTMQEVTGGWHLDKRVPVAIIFALLVQSAGVIWWASNMSSRQSVIEDRVAVHDMQISAMRDTAANAAVSLGRIEENVDALRNDIERVLQAINQ